MKRYAWILILLSSLALTGCHGMFKTMIGAGPQTKGNGIVKTETRKIGEFSKIDIGGAVEAKVTVGSKPSLKIEAESNLLPLIKSRVDGDTFVLEHEGSISTTKPIRVWLTVTSLKGISLGGASKLDAAGLKGEKFSIDVSGASTVSANGQVKALNIEASGASKVDVTKVMSKTAEVDASGASTIIVNATDSISGEASGASNIKYGGKPKTRLSTSGASSIESIG